MYLEFFDASPDITPKRKVSEHIRKEKKEENKTGRGVYQTQRQKSRYSSKDIIPQEESIICKPYI